jgi:hypothetical protein
MSDEFFFNFLLKNLKPEVTKFVKEPIPPSVKTEMNLLFKNEKD